MILVEDLIRRNAFVVMPPFKKRHLPQMEVEQRMSQLKIAIQRFRFDNDNVRMNHEGMPIL